MLKFKEGQIYVCTKAVYPFWTEGKEYEVELSDDGVLYLRDDENDKYSEHHINTYKTKFKLKEEPQSLDLIDNQPHYKKQGIEPIDLMRNNFSKEEFAGFLQGNVLKYMLRYKDKNGIEDLKKAKTYLTWLIEEVEQ